MTTGNEPPVPADPPADGPDTEPSVLEKQHRQHDRRGRFTRHPDTVERDAKAADMAARGYTRQQIADELGYSHRGSVTHAIQRARADVARPSMRALIARESDELDELYNLAMEIIHRNHVTVSHGKIICGDDGKPLQDDGPRLQAIQTALRIRDQYQNLHGLKQPAKTEISGGVTYEIVGVNPEDVA